MLGPRLSAMMLDVYRGLLADDVDDVALGLNEGIESAQATIHRAPFNARNLPITHPVKPKPRHGCGRPKRRPTPQVSQWSADHEETDGVQASRIGEMRCPAVMRRTRRLELTTHASHCDASGQPLASPCARYVAVRLINAASGAYLNLLMRRRTTALSARNGG
jgi:hypothetical protein